MKDLNIEKEYFDIDAERAIRFCDQILDDFFEKVKTRKIVLRKGMAARILRHKLKDDDEKEFLSSNDHKTLNRRIEKLKLGLPPKECETNNFINNMKLTFPPNFFWGTSTAAAQVESASEHNWKGLKSKDGYTFNQTTDHEKRRMEDAKNILQFGSVYRCGVDWARLQSEAFAPFDKAIVEEYQAFFQHLNDHGTRIMFVIHHFTNPLWFENEKGWLTEDNISAFVDYARQCAEHFGEYTFSWNIFNEPNVYALNGYVTGDFPPHKKNIFAGGKVLKNMGKANDIVYDILKEKYPDLPVGISFNTCYFKAKNPLGWLPATFTDWWFHTYAAGFFKKLDYWGISYYAFILFDPFPITVPDNPEKFTKMGIPHDKMWGYKPEGLAQNLRRFHKRFKKPMVITENGICTDDSEVRIASMKDYLKICHEAIADGIDLQGYVHWCTWDNFEWALGPTYRFGLVTIDLETMERTMTDAGRFYAKVARENGIEIEEEEEKYQ